MIRTQKFQLGMRTQEWISRFCSFACMQSIKNQNSSQLFMSEWSFDHSLSLTRNSLSTLLRTFHLDRIKRFKVQFRCMLSVPLKCTIAKFVEKHESSWWGWSASFTTSRPKSQIENIKAVSWSTQRSSAVNKRKRAPLVSF